MLNNLLIRTRIDLLTINELSSHLEFSLQNEEFLKIYYKDIDVRLFLLKSTKFGKKTKFV